MNSLILRDATGKITDTYVLTHIHKTLKLSLGDAVKCTVLNQGSGLGKVIELNQNLCQLEIGPIIPGKRPWFDLVVGASRPPTCKKILEHATTFGARSFHFFKSSLSEKSYLDSNLFGDNNYEEYLIAGLSQSVIYTQLPKFQITRYNPADQYRPAPQKFILDLKTDKSFLDADIDFSKPITLAVGPERGFINDDLKPFHDADFTSIKISSSILRVEHAVYSAISQLELLRLRSNKQGIYA